MAGETATDPVRRHAPDLLPPDPEPFVGRHPELAALRAEVARAGLTGPAAPDAGRPRVLVVAGRPGSGRTALAVRFARSVAADYPDGRLFARLAGPDGTPVPPGRAARELLAALGVAPGAIGLPPDDTGTDTGTGTDSDPETDQADDQTAGPAGDPAEDPACALLRRTLRGRRAVLVLDDVPDAARLRPLLPEEAGCLVVATAAGPLTGIADARPCVLGGLDPASAVALLTALVGETRVVCDPVGAAELAEACGCHPGALRLAAGWLRTRPRAAVPDAVQALADTPRAAARAAAAAAAPVPPPAPAEPPAARGEDLLAVWDSFHTDPPPTPSGAPPVTAADGDALLVWEAVRAGAAAPAAPGAEGEASRLLRTEEPLTGPRLSGRPAAAEGPAVPGTAPEASRPVDSSARLRRTEEPLTGPRLRARPAPGPRAAAHRGRAVDAMAPTRDGPRADRAAAPPPAADPPAADPADQDQHRDRDQPPAAVPPAAVPPAREAAEPPGAAHDRHRWAFVLLYRGLPAAQARLLRLLVLAPEGTADRRTASALAGCPADSAELLLRRLAEQQLLAEEPARPDGTVRYRLPARLYEPLAALLADTERPAETELARARLLERLVRLVDSCRALLAPEPGQPAPEPLPGALRLHSAAHARDWLARELPLLRAAVRDAVRAADLDGPAARLVAALVRTLPAAGIAAPDVLYELHGQVLVVARRTRQPQREAAALINLGDLLTAAGDHRRALDRYHAALEPARAAADDAAGARALEAVAGAHRALGDPLRAADWYGRALAVRRSRGEQRAEVRLLARLAEAHGARRRYEEAGREYRAALALLRRLGEDAAQVGVGLAAARLLLRAGQWEQALRAHREALLVARRVADPALEAAALRGLADALERTGDATGARLHRAQAAQVSGSS
ncbi:tetratricopeptide repeat protein [Streptomyces sp. NPDC092296]|uniref:tetratricopeptide repeat protein n=1 Tax=Streptomyces sp. NPDC092296 TaxID=3366012 RepID=UPI003825DCE1